MREQLVKAATLSRGSVSVRLSDLVTTPPTPFLSLSLSSASGAEGAKPGAVTAVTGAVWRPQSQALPCRRVCPPCSHPSPGVPCSCSYSHKALGLSSEAEHGPPTPGRCRQQPQNPDAVSRSWGRAPGDPALCIFRGRLPHQERRGWLQKQVSLIEMAQGKGSQIRGSANSVVEAPPKTHHEGHVLIGPAERKPASWCSK